jgi:hypothetical protein
MAGGRLAFFDTSVWKMRSVPRDELHRWPCNPLPTQLIGVTWEGKAKRPSRRGVPSRCTPSARSDMSL